MTTTTIPAFSIVLVNVVCPTSVVPGGPSTDPTDIWFPIPDTVPDVPTAPTPDTNPETIPGNSVTTGECFDPDNPDLDQIFNNLLPEEDTDGVPDESLDTGVLLPIDNELVPLRGILRAIASIRNYTYDLIPKVTDFAVTLKIIPETLVVVAELEAATGVFTITGSSASLVKPIFFARGSFSWSGKTAGLTYLYPALRSLSAETGSLRMNSARENLILSHFDTDFSEEIGLIPFWGFYGDNTANTPNIVASPSKFGGGSATFALVSQAHLYTYIPWSALQDYTPNFLMEVFVYPDDLFVNTVAFALGDQIGSYGYIVVYYYGFLLILRAPAGTTSGYEEVFRSFTGNYFVNEWIHVALEQTNSGLHLYCNGQLLTNSLGANSSLYVPVERLDLRNAIFVGGYGNDPGGLQYATTRGYRDEFRLSTGPSLASSFVPPSAAYPAIAPSSGNVVLSLRTKAASMAGSFALLGQDSVLKVVTPFAVSGGSYALTGQNATFTRASRVISCGRGDFALTGVATVEVLEIDYTTFSGTNFFNVPWPNGTMVGDFAIMVIETSAANSSYTPMMPPFGWTFVTGSPIRNAADLSAPSYLNVYKRFVENLSSFAAEIRVSSNHFAGAINTYRNVDINRPVIESVSTENPLGFPVTFPALTKSLPRTKVLYLATGGIDSSTTPTLSSASNSSTAWSNFGSRGLVATSSNDGGFAMAYTASVTRPVNGLPVTTATSNKTTHMLMTLALRPRGWSEPIEALAGGAGSFAFSGQAASLAKGYVAQALYGALSLAGQAAAFVYGKILTGSVGGASLVGQGADFTYSRRVAGDAGGVVLTGQTANLVGPGFIGEVGSFSLTGQPATLKRVLVAGAGSTALSGQAANLLDPNTTAYVTAVETADTQDLEFEVVTAIDTFIKGCKADGIWNAIKASCIMAGARTLAGALTPLVGTAPTNNNFVAGDYNRATGLVGDGSTKYLNSNRNNNADPQNSQHASVYATTADTVNRVYLGAGNISDSVTHSLIIAAPSSATNITRPRFQSRNPALTASTNIVHQVGLIGLSRSNSSNYQTRSGGQAETLNIASSTPASAVAYIFAVNGSSLFPSNARLSFYSIGESLDLALLDSRVSRLVNEIAFYLNTGLSSTGYDIDTLKYINAGYAAGGTLS